MITTLNQLIGYFEAFADAHGQIKDFGYGSTSEISTTEQMKFPYLWVTNATSSAIEVSRNKTVIPNLTFQFLVLDQWNNQSNYKDVNGLNSNNTGEIMSDTQQICMDIVNYVSNYLRDQKVLIPDGGVVTIEPIQDDTTDKAYGWMLTLDLKILNLNCNIPGDFDNINPPNPCECDVASVFNSDGSYNTTVESGGSLETPDIELFINGVSQGLFPSVKDIDLNFSGGSADSLKPTRTGQTISYATNDDGDIQFGRDTDFFTLSWTNPFGNNNRFTDTDGLQVYGNSLYVDWTTFDSSNSEVSVFCFGAQKGFSSNNWFNWLAGQPYTLESYSDWYMVNIRQMQSLANFGADSVFNYSPLNYNITGGATALWSNTVRHNNSSFVWVWYVGNSMRVWGTLTNNFQSALVRQFTLSELGL